MADKQSWWTKFWINPWWGFVVVLSILSVISFFQVNSYWADKNNFNGAWKVIGIVLGLGAIFCYWKTTKTSDGKGG